MTKPHLNVTPLIDILLVLLVIFMVVVPLKPSAFKARVPAEPDSLVDLAPDPKTLVVTIAKDATLSLNRESGLGSAEDTGPLVTRLKRVFEERIANGDISDSFADDAARPQNDRIERAVFIKGPPGLQYGRVARVVDAVKLAGAYPISLQIDHLDR